MTLSFILLRSRNPNDLKYSYVHTHRYLTEKSQSEHLCFLSHTHLPPHRETPPPPSHQLKTVTPVPALHPINPTCCCFPGPSLHSAPTLLVVEYSGLPCELSEGHLNLPPTQHHETPECSFFPRLCPPLIQGTIWILSKVQRPVKSQH